MTDPNLDHTTPMFRAQNEFNQKLNTTPVLDLPKNTPILEISSSPLIPEDSKYEKTIRAIKILEHIIMDTVSDYGDAFESIEIENNHVIIQLGGGFFWKLEMGVLDINRLGKMVNRY